ncbi:MAG: hypothetical protein LBJ98_03410 [Endomicrobium sp.]|jgi:hypothetical protein|nr:hypothetical protein [Endomicrobium sp.]
MKIFRILRITKVMSIYLCTFFLTPVSAEAKNYDNCTSYSPISFEDGKEVEYKCFRCYESGKPLEDFCAKRLKRQFGDKLLCAVMAGGSIAIASAPVAALFKNNNMVKGVILGVVFIGSSVVYFNEKKCIYRE